MSMINNLHGKRAFDDNGNIDDNMPKNKRFKPSDGDSFPLFTLFPNEIIIHIFTFSDYKTLYSLKQTCRRFKELVSTNYLWKELYLSKLNIPPPQKLVAASEREFIVNELCKERRALSLSHLHQPSLCPRIKIPAFSNCGFDVSQDGHYILSCIPGEVQVTCLATQEIKKFATDPDELVQQATFSSRREYIFAIADPSKKLGLYIWDATTKERIFFSCPRPISFFSLSSDDKRLVLSFSKHSDILLYRLNLQGAPVDPPEHTFQCPGGAKHLFFSHDNMKLRAISNDYQLYLYDYNGDFKHFKIDGTFTDSAFYSIRRISSSCNFAIIADNSLVVWDEATEKFSSFPCNDGEFSPNGTKVAYFTENHEEFILKDLLNPLTPPIDLFDFFERDVNDYFLSNNYLFILHEDGNIGCLNLTTMQPVYQEIPEGEVNLACWCMTERENILFFNIGSSIYAWKPEKNILTRIFKNEPVREFDLTENFDLIAVCDNNIIVLDFAVPSCKQIDVHFKLMQMPDVYGNLLGKLPRGEEYFLLFESLDPPQRDTSPSDNFDTQHEKFIILHNPRRRQIEITNDYQQLKVSEGEGLFGAIRMGDLQIVDFSGDLVKQESDAIDFDFIPRSKNIALLTTSELRIISLSSEESKKISLPDEKKSLYCDPLGRYLAIKKAHLVDIYDVDTVKIRGSLKCPPETNFYFIPHSEQCLLVDSLDASARLLSLDGKEISLSVKGIIKKWAVIASQNQIVTISDKGDVQLWCCISGGCIKEYSIAKMGCEFFDISSDARYIVSAADNPRSITLWELASGQSFPLEGEYLSYRKAISEIFFLPKKASSTRYKIICVTPELGRQRLWEISFFKNEAPLL